MDFFSLQFLIPYAIGVFFWIAAGAAICHATHRQRGIDVDKFDWPEISPDSPWANDPSAPKEPSPATK